MSVVSMSEHLQARMHPLEILELARRRGDPYDTFDDAVGKLTATSTTRTVLAIGGVSGAAGTQPVPGMSMSAMEAAAALALVTVNSVRQSMVFAYDGNTALSEDFSVRPGAKSLRLPAGTGIAHVIDMLQAMTPCAPEPSLPIRFAQRLSMDVDLFVVCSGVEIPHAALEAADAALREYRDSVPARTLARLAYVYLDGVDHAIPSEPALPGVTAYWFTTETPDVLAAFAAR